MVSPTIPSVTVYRLTRTTGGTGVYVEEAHVEGSASVSLTEPYELTLSPADLVR